MLKSKNRTCDGDDTLKIDLLNIMGAYKCKFEKGTADDFAWRNFKNIAPRLYYAQFNPIEIISLRIEDFCCWKLKKANKISSIWLKKNCAYKFKSNCTYWENKKENGRSRRKHRWFTERIFRKFWAGTLV